MPGSKAHTTARPCQAQGPQSWEEFWGRQGIRPGRDGNSALAGLEARVFLVDYVDAPMTAYDAAIFVAQFSGFQRILDFHDSTLGLAGPLPGRPEGRKHRQGTRTCQPALRSTRGVRLGPRLPRRHQAVRVHFQSMNAVDLEVSRLDRLHAPGPKFDFLNQDLGGFGRHPARLQFLDVSGP
jgi:hypothetical protein